MSGVKGVEQLPSGGMMLTGPGIGLYRLLAFKHAIKLEALGMKHSRGSMTARAKKEFGFKGNRDKVLVQLEAYIAKYAEANKA